MFVRQVDFQRDGEPEMLVLTGNFTIGERPQVLVSHSFFFDRKDKTKEDWVSDAEVSMIINSKAYPITYRYNGIYTSTSLPLLQAHDTIEVIATHPTYATATARQIMPGQVHSTLHSVELPLNYWLHFTLDFDAYAGNADKRIIRDLFEQA